MPFTLEEQLEVLSPEQLEELKQELLKQKESESPGNVAIRGVGRSLLSGAEGALLASQGRPISELSKPGKREISPEQELDTFEKKERIKAKIKQEFGGSGGMQIVQLPGGGFAVIPGGTQNAESVSSDLAQKKDAQGNPVGLEDVTITAGGIKGKLPKSEAQAARELEEQRRGKRSESVEKSVSAKRMGLQNIALVSGAAKELAQTYSDAVREGGMGSLGAQITAKASLFFGGEQAESFASTEAFPGSKTEIVARMMPLLTQQGDRPGSVRLVATIFDKLSLTLPGDKTPPKNARKMIEKTIRNMFRFARAADRLGLNDDFIVGLSDAQLKEFSSKVASEAVNVSLSDEENSALNLLISNVLAPIDELIVERGGELDIDEDEEFERFLRETR